MAAIRRTWVTTVAIVIASTLTATSCGGSSTAGSGSEPGTNDTVSRANKGVVQTAERPRVGGKLVYGLYSETNGWNPGANQWAPSGLQVTNAIFDTITAYDEHSDIKPYLAESFEHNADFTEWTIRLRPNVKLHNGKPVNADVVIRNQTYLSKSLVTGPAYRFAGVLGFTKVDDLAFRVTLDKGQVQWPIFLATQLGVVADPDWLESNDGLKPIGTGPFTMDTWEIDKKLTVRKNADYWRTDKDGTRLPYLDSIEFVVMPDTETRSKALQAKDVDIVETLSGQQLQSFQQQEGFQVYSDSAGESRELFVQLNTMAEPFTDPDARRALAYATDKRAYSDIASGGFDEVANGPIAPTSPWFTATDYPQYDPVKAKELVEKVKAKHDGKFEIHLLGTSSPERVVGAQTLQQQWATVGIDVTVELQEQAKLIVQVISGSYQATLWDQFDAPNPLADGVWWDADGAVAPPALTLNFARNKDEAISRAMDEAIKEPDFAKRKAQVDIVQQRLAADMPYIWLIHQRVSLIASNRVVNLVHYELPDGTIGLDLQQGAHHLAQIWLKD